ncbi:hypothetical protein [Alsobacter soli]|uniref:hypothetical protein n=1 Tax=Alsobacter soli TaxID=2109933 RepID=UPI0011B217D5|nr:hypothetical protein [Alsobacter soli]
MKLATLFAATGLVLASAGASTAWAAANDFRTDNDVWGSQQQPYGRQPYGRGEWRRHDYYGGPRYAPAPYGYGHPRWRAPARYSDTCITSRGLCPTTPAPYGSPCGCNIPGFGWKRGAVGN